MANAIDSVKTTVAGDMLKLSINLSDCWPFVFIDEEGNYRLDFFLTRKKNLKSVDRAIKSFYDVMTETTPATNKKLVEDIFKITNYTKYGKLTRDPADGSNDE